LANGLGNLISRVAALAEKSGFEYPVQEKSVDVEIEIPLKKFEINKSLDAIWLRIKEADILINHKKVWELKGEELQKILAFLIEDIRQIAVDLKPFLPETSEKIEKQYNIAKIKSSNPLFPRLKA
jgi:methionyl-tRNA synthetase